MGTPRIPWLLALAVVGISCGDGPPDSAREEAAAAGTERPLLPEPDPSGITFYPSEDVYAAGRLDWAWAIASDHGDLERIDQLLADGVDPDVLISGDYQASDAPRRHGRTALMEAAWFGYEDVARRLLEAGADPLARELEEDPYFSGDTALHMAASFGHVEIVRMLLDAGVPVDLEGKNGATPLSYAFDDRETFELLLEHGADLEKAGGATSLLDSAVTTRATDMAARLLELGADIEGEGSKRDYGYTPLWSAVVGGRDEMALFLLEHGADPTVETAAGDFVELARENGHDAIVAMLERAQAGESPRPPAEDPSQP